MKKAETFPPEFTEATTALLTNALGNITFYIVGGILAIFVTVKIYKSGRSSWEAAKPTIFTLQGLFTSIPWFLFLVAGIKIAEIVKH